MTLVQVPPVDGPSDPFDEQSLVERARTDRDAFAELYRLYLPRIYAFAYRRCGSRPLAEDVTAATFEEALRSLPSFVAKGGGFGPWLFRIAANEIVDHYRADERARGRTGHRALTLLAAPTGADNGGFDLPGSGEDHGRLLAALGTLNPRYQKAISLRYLSGLSHAEAAEAMGTTKPVMAVTLHRALRSLRRVLDVPPGGPGVSPGKTAPSSELAEASWTGEPR
jgi:RNA polymerase sigma-70 factor (ECF subfamily)